MSIKKAEDISGMMDRASRQKMVMIEIDGITWGIINPMLKKQQLPNFSKIIQKSSYGVLKSISPPLSPIIWTSIVSGKSPDKHGVNHFSLTANSVKCRRIWDIFTEAGNRCGIFGHLLTWPPPKLDCFTIPGFLAQGTETYPPELSFIKELAFDEKMGQNRNFSSYLKYFLKGLQYGIRPATFFSIIDYMLRSKIKRMSYKQDFYRKRILAAEINSDIFTYLYKKTQPDFSIFYLNVIDACCHQYWKFMEPDKFDDVSEVEIKKYKHIIPSVYRRVDDILGKLLHGIDEDTTLIVLSDHGFQAASAADNMPNCIVQTSKLIGFMGLLDQVTATNLALLTYFRIKDNDPVKLDNIKGMFKRIRVKEADTPLFDVNVDDFGNIALKVSQQPYSVLKTSSLKGKTISFDSSIGRYEELISEGDTKISGTHHLDGVLIMKGQNIRQNCQISNAHVLDITPTLLALKGMNVARDMEGKVLTDAIDGQFLQHYPISHIDTYESDEHNSDNEDSFFEEDENVMQRLKELGYIN